MPFDFHLKNALIKKGGIVSEDQNSVSFYKDDKVLKFLGSDENEMVKDLDGIKHERVRITLNGEELNLMNWLHHDTPILMTGKRVVKNIDGYLTDCSTICYKILKNLDFGLTN